MRSEGPPLLPLFRSEAQARLLATLFLTGEPDALRTMSDVAVAAGVPVSNAHRELQRLIDAGIVSDRRVGRQRLIAPAIDSLYYEPLRELLERAFGAAPVLFGLLEHVPGLEAAAIYGSYAARLAGEPGDPPRDIDLLVIGTVEAHTIYEAARAAESLLHREVNPTILTATEWQEDTGFIRELRSRPLRELIGHLPESGAA